MLQRLVAVSLQARSGSEDCVDRDSTGCWPDLFLCWKSHGKHGAWRVFWGRWCVSCYRQACLRHYQQELFSIWQGTQHVVSIEILKLCGAILLARTRCSHTCHYLARTHKMLSYNFIIQHKRDGEFLAKSQFVSSSYVTPYNTCFLFQSISSGSN